MTASVVCGVDDSPSAIEVIRVAGRMSEGLRLRFVLAHVVPLPAVMMPVAGRAAYAYSHPAEPEGCLDAGEERLETIARRVGKADEAELRTLVGDPVERLLALADEEEAELIVVGSRGRGPLKGALLGSVSAALTTRASCPVLVVPPGASPQA